VVILLEKVSLGDVWDDSYHIVGTLKVIYTAFSVARQLPMWAENEVRCGGRRSSDKRLKRGWGIDRYGSGRDGGSGGSVGKGIII
jgi:hypothetical protein